ncbi:cysteine desulfurase family protein [Pedobacter africanus]|uniref:cysteine desulfurase n=1 Tax=Pedobacter africanus TaxID=151894 RepID=A0A1W1ZIZ7_9SPHI|nr:cysteine desulfurase family protein [Pedobacter africanus]SMC48364.1 cysteine desulfurase [Pedobacter africanus]
MRIYLDNAATTPLSKAVFRAMEPYLFENFGNPSSAHHFGREARAAICQSRGIVADVLNTSSDHIIFTSGGTEADNTAIVSAICGNNIKLAITTALEHHAVLNTLKALEQRGEIRLVYLNHDAKGVPSLSHLDQLLAANESAFVSVMHGNNEIGNLNDIDQIAKICSHYGAIFHSDTVQTMGQYKYDTQKLGIDFLVGSAHKFHGPKGIGFLYKKSTERLNPFINGGAQEGGQRSGTENVAGIVGLARALELAYSNRESNHAHISGLKERMIYKLTNKIPGISFNGNSSSKELSLSTVLSVALPDTWGSPLTYLDQHRICASGGSACNSNSGKTSHVLNALHINSDSNTIRFSFSRYNTAEEIDYAVEQLACLFIKEIVHEVEVVD